MIYSSKIPFGLIEGSIGSLKNPLVYDLAINLEKEGQKKPFVVYVTKKYKFSLVSGDTRYTAYKYVLKKPFNFKVPCILISEIKLPLKKIKSYKELKEKLGNHLEIGIINIGHRKKLNIFTGKFGNWHQSGRFIENLQ